MRFICMDVSTINVSTSKMQIQLQSSSTYQHKQSTCQYDGASQWALTLSLRAPLCWGCPVLFVVPSKNQKTTQIALIYIYKVKLCGNSSTEHVTWMHAKVDHSNSASLIIDCLKSHWLDKPNHHIPDGRLMIDKFSIHLKSTTWFGLWDKCYF